ncbi:PREDICTED: CD83 antigen [Condylura cristata]|uniref:CD83 antigen n=1 Tax=Condylura cristata TaxID=143302 RepID=UPI0006433484|nr:PREDICTED: CD83 antigen [Condylura cristata]
MNTVGATCSLASAANLVMVACSKDAELPCAGSGDPRVSHMVSWVKLTKGSEERLEETQKDLYYQYSMESSGGRLYFLKIRNTTNYHSGTYKCMLEEPAGQSLQNSTVVLKVTGCREEDSFSKYGADIVLLLVLVIFYTTLIIFTWKFARHQNIFPEFLKSGMESAFLLVTSPSPPKPLELMTVKTEPV